MVFSSKKSFSKKSSGGLSGTWVAKTKSSDANQQKSVSLKKGKEEEVSIKPSIS